MSIRVTITCEKCGHEHLLDPNRLPLYGARVRCVSCGQLFDVPPRAELEVLDRRDRGRTIPGIELGNARENGELRDVSEEVLEGSSPRGERRANGARPAAVEVDPEGIARSLVGDVVYADEARFEAARREGRVLIEYATELRRAWISYRQRVGSGARSDRIFRAAVREVLGGRGR